MNKKSVPNRSYIIYGHILAIFLVCLPCLTSPLGADTARSFDELFPGLSEDRKTEVFSEGGLIRSLRKNGTLELTPAANSGIGLQAAIMQKRPAYLAESLMVIPYSGRTLGRLDAYNALGKIRDLKGRKYNSHSRGETPLFEDATRIRSAEENNSIPDPPPRTALPSSETVYIRLKDANFGNSYYRADVSVSPYGVSYSLSNFKSLTYLLLTVMREEKFSAILYLEPLAEGMLVYSVAGADASDFVANRIDIPSAIEKRLAVFIAWVGDGIRAAR